MYIWRVEKLVEDLRQDRISERETFKYFLVWTFFIYLETQLYELFPQPATPSMVFFSTSYTLIALLGVTLCYWTNANGDNRHFLRRFICLNLPLSIRLLVYFIVAGVLIFVGAPWLLGIQWSPSLMDTLINEGPFDYLFLLIALGYYLWVRSKIKKVSRYQPMVWSSSSLSFRRKAILAVFLIVSFGLPGLYHKNKDDWDLPITAFLEDNAFAGMPPALDLHAEDIFYKQHERVQQSLNKLQPHRPGKPDMYFVSFSSDWKEKRLMVESGQVQEYFENRFQNKGRSLRLVNHRETMDRLPLATVTNLKESLKQIAARMNTEEDILFLYITSHGSEFNEVTVEMGDLPMQSLDAGVLAELLKESGIKWKVIVINTCYSGGFIETIKDDTTLIMTAASEDELAYFCAWDREDCRDFSKALLVDGFNDTNSFKQAFSTAASRIRKLEEKHNGPYSQPQIKSTPQIEKKLEEWTQTLPPPPAEKQKAS